MRERSVKAGTVIFRERDPSDEVLVILDGTVEVLRNHGERQVLLGALKAGQIFGEMGVISGKPRSATARAVSNVTLASIPKDEFIAAFGSGDSMALRILRMVCERLRDADNRITASELWKARVVVDSIGSIRLLPASGLVENQIDAAGVIIEGLPYTVGRQILANEPTLASPNELFLQVEESCALSPRHFVIEDLFGDLIVHDLDSDAGTLVNGKRIARNEDSRVSLLQAGRNDIQVGGPDSPIRFTLVIETL